MKEAIWSVKNLVSQLDSATKYFSTAGHLELTLETLSVCIYLCFMWLKKANMLFFS